MLKELTKTAKNICDTIIPPQIRIHMCIICAVKLAGFTNILWSSF